MMRGTPTETLVFDTKAEWEAYEALALAACIAHHASKGYRRNTTAWSQELQRLDGKYVCDPCPHLDNSSYTSEMSSHDWFPHD